MVPLWMCVVTHGNLMRICNYWCCGLTRWVFGLREVFSRAHSSLAMCHWLGKLCYCIVLLSGHSLAMSVQCRKVCQGVHGAGEFATVLSLSVDIVLCRLSYPGFYSHYSQYSLWTVGQGIPSAGSFATVLCFSVDSLAKSTQLHNAECAIAFLLWVDS